MSEGGCFWCWFMVVLLMMSSSSKHGSPFLWFIPSSSLPINVYLIEMWNHIRLTKVNVFSGFSHCSDEEYASFTVLCCLLAECSHLLIRFNISKCVSMKKKNILKFFRVLDEGAHCIVSFIRLNSCKQHFVILKNYSQNHNSSKYIFIHNGFKYFSKILKVHIFLVCVIHLQVCIWHDLTPSGSNHCSKIQWRH